MTTVRHVSGFSPILHAYSNASLSSGPPKNSMTMLRARDSAPESPRSMRMPTEHGALARDTLIDIPNSWIVIFHFSTGTLLPVERDDNEGCPFLTGNVAYIFIHCGVSCPSSDYLRGNTFRS